MQRQRRKGPRRKALILAPDGTILAPVSDTKASSDWTTIDGNEAAASVAHRLSEVIAIYPITPSSTMGEFADEWSAAGKKNVWGDVPSVAEMQSEAGAAGAIHGALLGGSLATTFTCSQGLLLMIPNMFKIAGELTPFTMHVAARALATHALSIFGDHSDVMACRSTGFAMLCSGSVQEAHDFAAIAHAATLEARLPFLHFFDGFRTSHEVTKIHPLGDDTLRAMVSEAMIAAHRARALTPDHPVIRGTAQNPDVFFQAREACNPFHDACPGKVREVMQRFAGLTGRHYDLFDYVGHPEAERVIIMMGSGSETAHETVEHLVAKGERVGLVKVRLFRPLDIDALVRALPKTTRAIAVLDRCKEPGAPGDPLYLDVVTALADTRASGTNPLTEMPKVVAGRYGLSSKEFTPAMVISVFGELTKDRPRNHFTLGIVDDVTHRSLPYDMELDIEKDDVVRAVFFGLGSDGTVGSNKQTIKIIGEGTHLFAQAYFVYDSKKSGATTVSHLRFGPRPIRAPHLIRRAKFVACHATTLMDSIDVLGLAEPGATFLLNTPASPDEVWATLPVEAQRSIVEKKLRFYVIDGNRVAKDAGLERRVNTVMQACFFGLSGVLPRDEAMARMRDSVVYSYGKRGPEIVKRNLAVLDAALNFMHEVTVPASPTWGAPRRPPVSAEAPDFVQRVTGAMIAGLGDALPVSAFPPDGTWPTGTAKWEKRGLALDLPKWDEKLCIQCNKCAFVCPHAAIRMKVLTPALASAAPASFVAVDYRGNDLGDAAPGQKWKYALAVAPDDCTGCGLCVSVCPVKDKTNPRHKALDMAPADELRVIDRERYDYFLALPELDRAQAPMDLKGTQLVQPLFEYSGACSGCGETPYVKLLTQMFGDRLVVANATGCSSIYGGNLPTTPWTVGPDGRGPAWANSLFEDNAEFGLGIRLAIDAQTKAAHRLVRELSGELGGELVSALLETSQHGSAAIAAQRERVTLLRSRLAPIGKKEARELELVTDHLVRKSVWLVGGDGWAYDIGYGGLDHVLAGTWDVNILVLDTEVYSNTGGQQSKATPLGAAAKFAAAGKSVGKKDLGLLAMSYGHAYVASVAMGAKDVHTVRAFEEAEKHPGPSLIIAYSHCIAHGYDLLHGLEQQKLAVDSGAWPLYRYDPQRGHDGEAPLKLDAPAPKLRLREYMKNEGRFRQIELRDPKRYAELTEAAEAHAQKRRAFYEQMATVKTPADAASDDKKAGE
jgi:pyruvate-ferredoxin/flavodoxin oxidoreductase